MAVLLLLLCAQSMQAREQVRGTVTVSQLQAEQIVLTGQTTLLVDQDWQLSSITGNYQLEIILSDGVRFTVNDSHDQAFAVDVQGLDVTGDGTLLITGKHNGLRLNGGDLRCSGARLELEARNGVSSHVDGCALMGASSVTIDSSQVWIFGANVGIANAGNITVQGADTKCYISGNHGIATLTADGGQVGYGVDSLMIEDAVVHVTALDGSGIQARSVRVDGGTLDVTQSGGSHQDCAVGGAIEAADCLLQLHAEKVAVSAEAGSVHLHNCSASIISGNEYRAIQAQEVTIGGDDSSAVRIIAGQEAIYCEGDITISNHSVMAESHKNGHMAINARGDINIAMRDGQHDFVSTVAPIRAAGQMNMLQPYKVNDDPTYGIDAGGHGFVKADGKAIMGWVHLTRRSVQDWHVVDSTGLAPFAAGQCTAKGIYHVGEEVTLQLPQSLLDFVDSTTAQPHVAWYRSTGGIASRYEKVGEGFSYSTSTDDVQRYVYAQITFDSHDKCLLTNPIMVEKKRVDATPAKPELILDQNRLWVVNPKAEQEYVVLNTFKSVAALKEGDWTSAQSLADTVAPLRLQGTQGAVNYVYTRFKETAERAVGQVVLYSAIYYGTALTTKKIDYNIIGVNCTVTDDVEGMKNVPLGGVVRIEAESLPAKSPDFTGIAGWNWMLMGGTSRLNESGYGVLYADSACTEPVVFDNDHRYTTVYARFDKPTEYNLAVLYVYWKSTGTYTALFNVSNADGTYEPATVTAARVAENGAVAVTPGATVEMALDYKPLAASLDDVNFTLESGVAEGEAVPSLTFNPANKSLAIDATRTEDGFTGRYAIRKGVKKVGEVQLRVAAPSSDSLAIVPSRVTIGRGMDGYRLDAVFRPANARNAVEWTTSDSLKATVDSTGRVTLVDNDAMVGDSVLIIAKSGDCMASCVVRIGGDRYPIRVDGRPVNCYNHGDVLHDRTVRLTGHVLTLDQAKVGGLSSNIDPLFVKVLGENSVAGQLRLESVETVFMGGGELTVGDKSDEGVVHRGKGTATLTVTGGTTLTVTECSGAGIVFPRLRVTGEETAVSVGGYYPLMVKDLWGNIVAPEGAQLEDGCVVDAENRPVHNELVVISGAETVPLPSGDVNRDRRVNVSDVTALINMILGVVAVDIDTADVDGNGRINVSDLTALINIILG